jgi:hypothetical protein
MRCLAALSLVFCFIFRALMPMLMCFCFCFCFVLILYGRLILGLLELAVRVGVKMTSLSCGLARILLLPGPPGTSLSTAIFSSR